MDFPFDIMQAFAPGALPAGAVLWLAYKLDRRILALEVLVKRLPCEREQQECPR